EASIRLEVPSSSSRDIIGTALQALRMGYRPGFEYKRAGVIVSDIVDASSIQQSIFGFDPASRDRDDRISRVMDQVNTSGKNVLRLGTQRPGHYADGIRREFCSKLFTTSWAELLEVR
ncbi:MAG: DUF4113 domain-containing protein, partial [Bacteroidales bacterium]|nr:DUF4113 domain-containing protein [Bacteroidales bacterium]